MITFEPKNKGTVKRSALPKVDMPFYKIHLCGLAIVNNYKLEYHAQTPYHEYCHVCIEIKDIMQACN